jgi:hypothetical protein
MSITFVCFLMCSFLILSIFLMFSILLSIPRWLIASFFSNNYSYLCENNSPKKYLSPYFVDNSI